MEKYSHFRDKATGIGPFFGNPISNPDSPAAAVGQAILSTVSVILRVPIILITFTLVAIINSLESIFPFLGGFLYSAIGPLLSILLLVAGISSWDIQTEGHKKKYV